MSASVLIVEELLKRRICVAGVGEQAAVEQGLAEIPNYLYARKWTRHEYPIVVATSNATRMARVACCSLADERHSEMGQICGFKELHSECVAANTRIIYTTPERLLHDLVNRRVSEMAALLLDYTELGSCAELILFHAKKMMLADQMMRLVVFCKQAEQEPLVGYYGGRKLVCPCTIQAARPEVSVRWIPDDSLANILSLVKDAVQHGNVVVFVPGRDIGDRLAEGVEDLMLADVAVYSCYAGRNEVSGPSGRCVYVSTGSVDKMKNVKTVIDFGYKKIRRFSHDSQFETLAQTRISKAEADARACVVSDAGTCYRLCSKTDFMQTFPEYSLSEMQYANPAKHVLSLLALGYDRIGECELVSNLPSLNVQAIIPALYCMDAINDEGQMTETGGKLLKLPVPLQYALMIYQGDSEGCGLEIIKIVSVLCASRSFPIVSPGLPKKARVGLAVEEGDHISMLNMFNGFLKSQCSPKWCHSLGISYSVMERALVTYDCLRSHFPRAMADCVDHVLIRQCIAKGLFMNAATAQSDGSYKCMRTGRTVWTHPDSLLFHHPPPLVVYDECVVTSKPFIKYLSRVEFGWLAPADHSGFFHAVPKKK